MTQLRPELPPLPRHMRRLPVRRGYPVPWFVEWVRESDEARVLRPCPIGQGDPDFRIMSHERLIRAVRLGLCWVCGGKLGRYQAFTIGPMCAVNRTSAEPPSHLDCSEFSARACPFLTRPHARRREAGLPDERAEAAGVMLSRNPGVAGVWITTHYGAFTPPGGGILFNIGDPVDVRWFCEGRAATREEVEESIRTGLPKLEELAAQEEGGLQALDSQLARARELLPA